MGAREQLSSCSHPSGSRAISLHQQLSLSMSELELLNAADRLCCLQGLAGLPARPLSSLPVGLALTAGLGTKGRGSVAPCRGLSEGKQLASILRQ